MTTTPAVSLRPRTDDDLDMLFEIAAELDTWEERTPEAPRPVTRDRFDAQLAKAAEDGGSSAPVSLVVDLDGTGVGVATLFDLDHLARHAEAGIDLVRSARGRGIGTAAVIQLVEFGFVRHNLRRIHLQAIASNVAAIRAYEKAGFVVEGRQRQHAWVRGGYEDIVRMGILRSEHTPVALTSRQTLGPGPTGRRGAVPPSGPSGQSPVRSARGALRSRVTASTLVPKTRATDPHTVSGR